MFLTLFNSLSSKAIYMCLCISKTDGILSDLTSQKQRGLDDGRAQRFQNRTFWWRSEAVEGGGHGVDTKLEESLTEGEAGAGEHDARHHGGRHHGQDQRQRQVPLRHGFRGDWRVRYERGRGWEETGDKGKAHMPPHMRNITTCHKSVEMTVDLLCHFMLNMAEQSFKIKVQMNQLIKLRLIMIKGVKLLE